MARDPRDATARLHLCGLLASQDEQRAAVAQALAAATPPPGDPRLLGDVVAALVWAGEMVAARALLDSPLIAASRDPVVLARAAGQRRAIGEQAAALALLERAREHGAGGRDFDFHHGVQLAFNGHIEEARHELERCITYDPPLGRAFLELARMSRQTPHANHLPAIAAALKRAPPRGYEHAALEFARYKELEDLDRHDEAWGALARGNRIMQALLPHDAAREARLCARMTAATAGWSAPPARRETRAGPQPIFVLGLPRSGTTVLERLLDNHSQVVAAGELGDFPRSLGLATDHLAAAMFDDTTLARLPDLDWTRVRDTYLAQTQWRAHGRACFVDKLPRNWMVAGLVHRAFPQAPILHVTRDPMDTCFSNWRAWFGNGAEYAYSYELEALAAHHRHYRQLMAHWHRIAPGAILDVDHGRLARSPATEMARVLDFCGLAHEPACADLARNRTPSATLSMLQVRGSLRTDTSRAWYPYRGQLTGLLAALGDPPATGEHVVAPEP